jgi:hypothetical protein
MIHKPTPSPNTIVIDKSNDKPSIFKKISNIFNSKEKIMSEKMKNENENENELKGGMTAIVHAGADLLLRTAYCPDKFIHRVVLLNSSSDLLQISENIEKKIDEKNTEIDGNGQETVNENSEITDMNREGSSCSGIYYMNICTYIHINIYIYTYIYTYIYM